MKQSSNRPRHLSRFSRLPRRLPMSLIIGAVLGAAQPVWALDQNALPTGGTIVAGSGSIGVSGNTLTVNQQSQQLITNWQNFNIGSDASVNFMQPSSSAIALARVLSNDASQIYGNLNANGQVFLVNPNGVFFAPGANVNVGGIAVSTLDISNDDFLAGRHRFVGNGKSGSVVNAGRIHAAGGYVALVGAQVVNEGAIEAAGGQIALAAGDQVTLDFHGDRLLMVSVDQAALAAEARNSGLLAADGGTVLMQAQSRDALMQSVVNNSGIIRARSIGTRDGVVVLDGGDAGVVTHSGSIDVSGLNAGETGGVAKVLGDKVALLGDARIDASGDAGGGTIRVGGSYKGEGSERNASATVVGTDVVLSADALTQGNGGEVIVWADDTTRYFGHISARGGAQGGDGGFVETSGKEFLEAYGSVDASALNGKAGTWLLDPRTLTIAATNTNGAFDGGAPNVFTPTANNAVVDVSTINASLNNGTSVVITTGSTGTQVGDITLTSGTTVSKTAGGDATLSLLAARHVVIQGTIVSTSGALDVILNSGVGTGLGAVALEAGAQIITNGGNFTAGGGADPTTGYAVGTGTRNNGFSMEAAGSSQSTGTLISTGAGNVLINAQGGGNSSGFSMTTSGGYNTILTTSGTITINAIAGGTGAGINISSGNNTIATTTGDITLSASAGSGRGVYIYSSGHNAITSQSGNLNFIGDSASGTDVVLAPTTGTTYIGTHTGATAGHDLSFTGDAAGIITIVGNRVELGASGSGSLNVAGTGDLVFQTRSAGTAINIGSAVTGGLDITAGMLANVGSGFASIQFQADDSASVDVGAISFADNVAIRGSSVHFSDAFDAQGSATISAVGAITQSHAISTTGQAQFSSDAGDIVLTNAGNAFGGAVAFSGQNASVHNHLNLLLGASALTGNLSVSSDGMIGQSGALTVAGALTATSTLAGAGDATFNNSGTADTQLGDIRVGGDFDLITAADDAITQAGGTHLEIGRNFDVSGGTLAAPAADNAIGGLDNSAGAGTVTITQIGVVDLSSIDVGAGAGVITTSASETLNVQSLASGTSVSAAGAGTSAINLSLGNAVSGQVNIRTGAQATVSSSGTQVATGIVQNGASLNVGGAASFSTAASSANAGGNAGNIVLDGPGNVFAGPVSVNGHDVTIHASGALNLGSANAAQLAVNTGGALTQSAAINAQFMQIDAGAANVTLQHASNSIAGIGIDNAADVALVNNGAIALDAIAANSFTLAANGDVTQTAGLDVTGVTDIAATGFDIVLDHDDNELAGTVRLSGRDITVHNGSALELGAMQASGNVALLAAGAITQSANLQIAGNLSLETTHAGGAVTIDNSGAATTQIGESLVGGNFVVIADGQNVTQAADTLIAVAGDFSVDAQTGTMHNTVVGGADNSQPGTTVIKRVGVIALDDITATGNLSVVSLASAQTFAGGPVSGTAVNLAQTGNSIGGTINVKTQAPTLNAAGADVATGISQSADTTISVAGDASFTASGGAINLSNAANHFGGNVNLSGTNVAIAGGQFTSDLNIAQTAGAALSNLIVGGQTNVTGAGATRISGNLALAGNLAIGGDGTSVILDGDTAITTTGNSTVAFGALQGGSHNLSIEAHDLMLSGDWSGTGNMSLRANTAAKTVGIGGGAGTFNLSAQEMAYIGAAELESLTVGRADGTGAVTLNAFAFDDALAVRGGAVSIAGGSYALDGGIDVAANGNLSAPSGATLNITTQGGDVRLVATGNVTFNSATATAIETNGGNLTIASRHAGAVSGYVDLRNTTIDTAGGNVIVGGGAAPETGYAIGTTLAGVRLGQTTITSDGGNIVINGQSNSAAGVSMGTSADTTLSSGAGDITVRGVSSSNNGLVLQSGVQTISTTTGTLTFIGTSDTSNGIRLGSTTAGTVVSLSTAGGDIVLVGTSGSEGDGLNIGAGAVSLIATGEGALRLTGTAAGSGNGVTVLSSTSADTTLDTDAGDIVIVGSAITGSGANIGPVTTGSGTTTTISSNSGNISVTGTSTDLYGINLTANGGGGERGEVVLATIGGDITLNGSSQNNIGLRNNAQSSGQTTVQTVDGNITYIGHSDNDLGITINPTTASGNTGAGRILATGNGNIRFTANAMTMNGSRVTISGNGGTLRFEPLTAGTTVGFGSGTSGDLSFSDSELAAIDGGFSTVYVGNAQAGFVSNGLTHGVENVVLESSVELPLFPGAPSIAVVREAVQNAQGYSLNALPPVQPGRMFDALQFIKDGNANPGLQMNLQCGKAKQCRL